MVASLIVMGFLSSVEQGWKILIGLGAGTGLVFILRWYWWRVNAWSEISAMVASFVTSLVLTRFGHSMSDTGTPDYAFTMLTTVAVTTVVWLAVTFATAPESDETLDRFYRQVRPGGPGLAAGGPAARVRRRPDPRRGPLLGELGGGARGGLLRGVRGGRGGDRLPTPGAGLRGRRNSGFLVDPA